MRTRAGIGVAPNGARRADRRRRSDSLTGCLTAVLLAAVLASTGCEPYGVGAPAGADTVSAALGSGPLGGTAHLFLYRISSRETGERLGVGRSFRVEPDRQVRAVLQLEGWDPRRDALVHIMWINPDGKEVYTKETTVLAGDWADEERRAALAKRRIHLEPETGRLEIESRYGVDPIRLEEELHRDPEKRRFKLGTWEVRAFLYRKRLLTTSFELTPER
jgi:hypothetical protein